MKYSLFLAFVTISLVLMPNLASAAFFGGLRATASVTGAGQAIVGPDAYNMTSTQPMTGSIDIKTEDVGNRWSAEQNIDRVSVMSQVTVGSDTYAITVQQAMPRHPLAKYTTWFGVVYDAEMHGDTGIGTDKIPKVKPAIALWGYAEVKKNGTVISTMAPAHVMVMPDAPMKGITLEVAAEDKSLIGTPDGYLNFMWPEVAQLATPEQEKDQREWLGWGVLLLLTLGFGWLAEREAKVKT